MEYVESFELFGTNVKQIPCIPGKGAPTTSTEGAVGCLYMDTDAGTLYKCTAVADGVYTWEPADGYSPTAKVTQTDSGAIITITDKNGTTTATITNGKPGADGHTPVKGTDYWTEADKAEMVADVIAALPVYVTPEMFGAKGDGVTNDTVAFQKAIDSDCPFIFVPEKTYVVDGFILRSNIHIFGNGTLKMCGAKLLADGSSYCVCGDGISNAKIEGLTIETYNRPTFLGKITNANNITLCDTHIEGNAWSDDLVANDKGLVNGIFFETSKNITLNKVHLKGVLEGKGIDFYECEHSIVKNCRVSYTGRGGIYATRYNNNIHIMNNVVEYSVLNFDTSDGAIDLYATNDNVTIEGNYINYYGSSRSAGCGIRIKDGDNNKAINNVINITSEYSFAALFVQTRDVNISNVSLIGNKIHLEEDGKTNFYIRVATSEGRKINGVVISENVISSNTAEYTATETISLRSEMKNVIVTKNKLFVDSEPFAEAKGIYHIYAQEDDEVRENIIIAENILVDGEIYVRKTNGGVIDGNIITYRTQKSIPIHIRDCNDIFVRNNILKTTRTDITDGVRESGTNTNIIKDNILVTLSEAYKELIEEE